MLHLVSVYHSNRHKLEQIPAVMDISDSSELIKAKSFRLSLFDFKSHCFPYVVWNLHSREGHEITNTGIF